MHKGSITFLNYKLIKKIYAIRKQFKKKKKKLVSLRNMKGYMYMYNRIRNKARMRPNIIEI